MTLTVDDGYRREWFHGKLLDVATITALKECEDALDYELTIVQGIGGAAASAGTHLEGRAVDLAPWDADKKVRILKDHGFAAWYRAPLPGVWGAHIHAVLILNTRDNSRGLADSGFRQIGSYDRGRNGLANDAVDGSYRPSPPVTFHFPPPVPPKRRKPKTKVSRARNRMVEALAALDQAKALLDDTAEGREFARRQIPELDTATQIVEGVLSRLPKR